MANVGLNRFVKIAQRKTMIVVVLSVAVVFIAVLTLIHSGKSPHAPKDADLKTDLTGIVDEAFSEANSESALTAQQASLDALKKQLSDLKQTIALNKTEASKHVEELTALMALKIKEASALKEKNLEFANASEPSTNSRNDAQSPWQNARDSKGRNASHPYQPRPPRIHSMRYTYGHKKRKAKDNYRLNPEHYVPSGTFVRAVILGGADADASVNGQSKNNGVMLFKLLQPGTLPNGKRSHLQGCFVTGSSYGDISSERAYVVLDKLSCAEEGKPIIDKTVTGWAFFGGKVGIKGRPLMRDNKVMQWAGISGAMSGIAAAAQYSQSIQSISALGSATTVPSGNIAPYAAYGGASKAADTLSQYYVKRAEQYHPVIQVGSGNLVTIVFKDGFYLEPDEAQLQARQQSRKRQFDSRGAFEESENEGSSFDVPPEVLSQIDKGYVKSAQGDNS